MRLISTAFKLKYLTGLCWLLWLVIPSALQAQSLVSSTRYVKQGGTGDGSSWEKASGDLQSMIDGDGVQQVWIAKGIYHADTTAIFLPITFANFHLRNGVKVYGGFQGTERLLSERPPINPVSGQPSSTTLSADFGQGRNSIIVLRNINVDTTALLDGVVISGAINNYHRYGGGIYNENGSPTLANCLISDNIATEAGGGMFNNLSSPILINCVISNNSANTGGGIYNFNSNTRLINCIISHNTAHNQGGGMFNFGIGNTQFLTNCIISNNWALNGGGGMANITSSPVLVNCLISHNQSAQGGGLYNSPGQPSLINCTLAANRATVGAALTNYSSQFQLSNCILFDNQEVDNTSIRNFTDSHVTLNYCLIGQGESDYSSLTSLTAMSTPFADNDVYQLAQGSLAIDAGDPTSISATSGVTDLAGHSRFVNNRIDIGAYEYQGNNQSPAITQQPPISSAVCAGATVTAIVLVTGSSLTYQWYKDGQLVDGQTTATFSLTNVQPAQSGSYSVIITSLYNSLTSTTFTLTVNPTPDSPTLMTASGYSYMAGQTSLTLSQNVGPIQLLASSCPGGQLEANGSSTNSFTISTATTGTQTYTATCIQNGCTSSAASFQLTVVPTTLSVLHRDADYGNTQNNIIKPYLELANAEGQAIPYGEVTVRYWFTSEGNAPPTNLAVYYAQLGAVNMNYIALDKPRQGASGYVEYSFPGGGSLVGGSKSGPIENGIQKTNGSAFDESDDYSYRANYQDYLSNAHITAYRNGVIVWGQEPTSVTSQTAVQVYSQAKDGTTTSQIQTRLELRNTGNIALPVANLRIRYYFTSDNNEPASVYVDYADMGASHVAAKVVKLPALVGGADSYVELSFPVSSMQINALSSLGAIDFRLVRSDYGLFDQSNDYSFAANYGNVGHNNHVTVLLNNVLIFGTPPNGAPARTTSQEPTATLGVRVLSNPVMGNSAEVEITGVSGQAVSLKLVDIQGRAIHEQRIEQASELEQVSLPLGSSRGQLLLNVSTASQQQSLKLLRP